MGKTNLDGWAWKGAVEREKLSSHEDSQALEAVSQECALTLSQKVTKMCLDKVLSNLV